MKRIMFVSVLALASLGAQAQSIGGPPYIAVHGKAKTEVVPDIFPLTIVLEETSLDAAKTQALIEGYASQVVELAESMKMADADVDVSNLSASPEYRYDDKDDKQVFLGNTYRREIKLRFHALADMKKAIGALPKAEQVRIDTGNFESSKQDELRRELLASAVEDAHKTAIVMANAVGRRVGEVHNISNQGFNVRYVSSGDAATLDTVAVSGTRYAPPTPSVALREGTIQLDQDVYIIYTLVD